MHKAIAIIGMNFGDEGKGHITDFFCDENTLNVRFNGGCQAGHAVVLSDGRGHIFKTFGSGSLKSARTMFGKHFIVNPILFLAELQELTKKGTQLREVFIDPRCRVTTPYDMLMNEFISSYRKTHMTTGFGINETVERSQYAQLKINVKNLIDNTDISKILDKIEQEYIPYRIEENKIPFSSFNNWVRSIDIKGIIKAYMQSLKTMLSFIVVWPEDDLITKYLEKDNKRKLVFEGAQGFMLDQNRKNLMPFLTRSNTGMQNIFECLSRVNVPIDMDVYLVTRTYITRHGDGPLWNESIVPYLNINNTTNPYNPYQGDMRYGCLNKIWYDKAIEEIENSFKNKPACIKKINLNVAMTHLDKIIDNKIWHSVDDGKIKEGSIDDFQKISLISTGNSDTDIKEYNP